MCCDQHQVLDLAARHGRNWERLPGSLMDEVQEKVKTFFETDFGYQVKGKSIEH